MPKLLCLAALVCAAAALAADEPEKGGKEPEQKPRPVTEASYRIYDAQGKPATLDDLLGSIEKAQVTFLGETHDDPVAHHLQEKLFAEVYDRGAKGGLQLALSLEMFERDVQPVLDEYLAGLITEQHFLGAARAWKNYKADYKPLVEFAREHKVPVIAANAPRRYVNRVGRLGADSLADIPTPLLRGLPPLPHATASPEYAKRFQEVMDRMAKEHEDDPKDAKGAAKSKTDNKDPQNPQTKSPGGKDGGAGKQPPFDMKKALQAQTLWDATMAYSIAEHLLRSPQAHVIHLNGSFHTDGKLGVVEHLEGYRPGTRVLVVTILSEESFPEFDRKEMAGRGDFVIVTDPACRAKKTPPAKDK